MMVVRGVRIIRLSIAIAIVWVLIIRATVMRRTIGIVRMPACRGFFGCVIVIVTAAPVVRIVAVARGVARAVVVGVRGIVPIMCVAMALVVLVRRTVSLEAVGGVRV